MPKVTAEDAKRIRAHATQLRYLQLLEQHETATAVVYELFAQKIRRKRRFWSQIAKEEHAHANVVSMLHTRVDKEEVIFSSRSLEISLILDSLSFLNAKITFLESTKPRHAEALHLAERIEKMIIERGLFRIFAAGTPEMEREFEALRQHTQEHIQRIRKEMKKRGRI